MGWKRYTKRKHVKKHVIELEKQEHREMVKEGFNIWKTEAIKSQIQDEQKVKNYQLNHQAKKGFNILNDYRIKNEKQRTDTKRAYAHIKGTLLNKMFKKLKYITFESGKRQMY